MFEYPQMKVIYEDHEIEETEYPYVPGFLAFKEIPVYTKLFEKLKKRGKEWWPQLLMVDGNGILHTRNFGCASHIGVLQTIPTIGVGKTVFYIDGITKSSVKTLSESLLNGGDFCYLTGDSGK
jgi:deoxyinosine 3'endonuclease (endonuclease V)